MVDDVPSFMRQIPDTQEGKDAAEVLGDAPVVETPAPTTETPAPTVETPKVETTTPAPTVEPKVETPAPVVPAVEPEVHAEDVLRKPPAERSDKEKDMLAKATNLTDEMKKQLADEAAAAVTPPAPTTPSSTDAAKKVVETLNPQDDTRKVERAKLMETIETLKKVPLINPTIPDPSNYYNEDKTFNVQGYMTDALKNMAIATQQAILGGPIAATLFGMLHDALREEDTARSIETQKAQESVSILNKITDHAPVLKTDAKLQARFERAIWGEKARRASMAKADGKEPAPMTYEDYEGLIDDLISTTPSTPAPAPDVTVSPPGGPTLGGGDVPQTEVDKDIAGMMGVKNKQLF